MIADALLELETHQTYNLHSNDLLFGAEIEQLHDYIADLTETKDEYESRYLECQSEYTMRKDNYAQRENIFKNNIQHITEKYIFAIDDPVLSLKKSYIELFLINKIDISFLQGSSYQFSLRLKNFACDYISTKIPL
jgi:peptidoglycan/xylan/chitin deacetylase (PgdA/CDA1 family)